MSSSTSKEPTQDTTTETLEGTTKVGSEMRPPTPSGATVQQQFASNPRLAPHDSVLRALRDPNLALQGGDGGADDGCQVGSAGQGHQSALSNDSNDDNAGRQFVGPEGAHEDEDDAQESLEKSADRGNAQEETSASIGGASGGTVQSEHGPANQPSPTDGSSPADGSSPIDVSSRAEVLYPLTPAIGSSAAFSTTSWQHLAESPLGHDSNYVVLASDGMPSDSPIIGSILSSSDDESRGERSPQLLHANEYGSIIAGESTLDDQAVEDDYETVEDVDVDVGVDVDDDGSSTVPSFVMPRVVLPTDSINVQVIGPDNNLLIERLQSYKKTLKKVTFQIGAVPQPKLQLLIVNRDNCLIPRISKLPYIALVVGSDGAEYVSNLPPQYMVSEPLRLDSLDDDLTVLIDFLSSFDVTENLNDLIDKGTIGRSMRLNCVNSVLWESASRRASFDDNTLTAVNTITTVNSEQECAVVTFGPIRKTPRRSSDTDDPPKNRKWIVASAFVALSLGLVSFTLLSKWNDTTDAVRSVGLSADMKPTQSAHFVPPRSEEFDPFVAIRIDSLAEDLASWSRLLLSETSFIVQRARTTLKELIAVFT